MTSQPPPVKLVLTSIDGLDDISIRTILVTPDKPVPIGRSSKNPDKGLMAASDNALIDSPVISREHAVFSTTADMDSLNVCINDEKSRQGTYLNGHEIKRGTSHKLEMGDTLCFGQNVVRDTDSFKAQKYHVSYRWATPEPDRAFPSGISVPEVVTSDEEEADIEEVFPSSPYPARYGSMINPVNVDDFEDDPPHPQPAQQPPRFSPEEEDQDFEVYEPPPPTLPMEVDPVIVVTLPEAPAPAPLPLASNLNIASLDAESSDEEEDEDMDEDMDEEDEDEEDEEDEQEEAELEYPDEEDNCSDVSSQDYPEYGDDGGESIAHWDDDYDLPQGEADALRAPVVEPIIHLKPKLESTINHDLPKPPTQQAAHLSPTLGLPSFQSIPSNQAYPTPFTHDTFEPTPVTSVDKSKEAQPPKLFSDAYTNSWDTIGASVPRPQAPKPYNWSTMDYSQPIMLRGAPNQNSWPDEPYQGFLPSNVYNRSNITGYPATNYYEHKTIDDAPFGSESLDFNHARPSTPPAQPLEPRPEGTPNQPAVRTKLSITDIVDGVLDLPLTPNSVETPPSRKRKANVLELDNSEIIQDTPEIVDEVTENTVSTAAPKEEKATERPAKKARSTFSLVASAMAAGFVLGGTVVISALASIDISQ